MIKAREAWDIVYPGDVVSGPGSTIVAVIDTGVEYDHEDFYINGFPAGYSFPNPPTVITNLWVNTLFPPGYGPQGFNNGKDDDNDGFINDYFGINTSGSPATPANEVMDTVGHGTAMAGIIGAFGNNNLGIAGINWQTQLMALKCMSRHHWRRVCGHHLHQLCPGKGGAGAAAGRPEHAFSPDSGLVAVQLAPIPAPCMTPCAWPRLPGPW